MTDFFDLARGALHAQPFSMVLGTELVQIGASEVALRLPIRDELKQQHGFVHGGVISYLADNALTFAGAIALGPRVVTGEFKINDLRPAVRGALLARGASVASSHKCLADTHRSLMAEGVVATVDASHDTSVCRAGACNLPVPHLRYRWRKGNDHRPCTGHDQPGRRRIERHCACRRAGRGDRAYVNRNCCRRRMPVRSSIQTQQ